MSAPPTAPRHGTAEHAAELTKDRHPGIQSAMAWLAFSHLPKELRDASRPFYQTGVELLFSVPNDSAELTTAFNALVGAKDWAVRALIRSQQGKPGPVPRPADVVDRPNSIVPHPADVVDQPNSIVPHPARFDVARSEGNYGAGQVRVRPIRDNPQA